ncbi:MAG: metallophosphoesterase [Anaerolineae bacterium]
MRIIVTSDLHFHIPWHDTLKAFAKQLEALEADLFIIAGDLGEPLEMFNLCLKTFSRVSDHRAALAGNHDVWHRAGPNSSRDLWDTYLSRAAQKFDYHWLDERALVVGGLGIAGSIAWYDYSGGHPDVNLHGDEYEQVKPMISNDGNYIDWGWSDREFAALVGEELEERLQMLSERDDVTDILVVTHVPLFDGTQRYEEDGSNRIIANAYYANLTLGQRVLTYPKVRMAVSGHVHVERQLSVSRNGSAPLPVYTNPSDYGNPAALLIDTETWAVQVVRSSGSA